MKVRAKFSQPGQFGFHGIQRYYDGDEFDYDGALASWMEEVEEEEKPKRKRRTKAEMEADDNDNVVSES